MKGALSWPISRTRVNNLADDRHDRGHLPLSGQRAFRAKLARVELAAGKTLPCDRLYAIENGPSGFDPAAPGYFPKTRFLMLMRNERLAALETSFDDNTHVLTVNLNGREAARGDLRTPEGRAAIEQFFAGFCADELRGPPKILHAAATAFPTWRKKSSPSSISLPSLRSRTPSARRSIHCASAAIFMCKAGRPGANSTCWERRSPPAARRLKVVKRIARCAATNVEPRTGIRDLQIPDTLMRAFGHADCGIYAEVVAAGAIRPGDRIGETAPPLPL